VKDGAGKEAKELTQVLHHYQVQEDLLLRENQGLRESLATKKKRNKHGKKLDMHREGSYHGGAEWWSPKKFSEALEREERRKATEEQTRLEKAERKELKASNALLKKKHQAEKCVEREKLKKEREKEKEKKAQEQAQKKQQKEKEKQAANLPNPVQLSQIVKRTASNKTASKDKRVKRCTGGASGGQGGESSQAPPPKITSRGRNVTLFSKFR
jgi:outer membrane biosynthesis protein TonB